MNPLIRSNGLVREVLNILKAADMLQAEGLFRHCLEALRGGLTVHTAIEHLVWAHKRRPEEVRAMATEFCCQHGNRVLLPTWQQSFVANGRAIRKDARETMALLKALPDCVGQDLLEAVLDLTAYGASCLYISAENGQLDVVNAMLEAGGRKTVMDVAESFFRC